MHQQVWHPQGVHHSKLSVMDSLRTRNLLFCHRISRPSISQFEAVQARSTGTGHRPQTFQCTGGPGALKCTGSRWASSASSTERHISCRSRVPTRVHTLPVDALVLPPVEVAAAHCGVDLFPLPLNDSDSPLGPTSKCSNHKLPAPREAQG